MIFKNCFIVDILFDENYAKYSLYQIEVSFKKHASSLSNVVHKNLKRIAAKVASKARESFTS